MRTYRIESTLVEAKTKKEAVAIFLNQHWGTFMCEYHLKFSTLYKRALVIN